MIKYNVAVIMQARVGSTRLPGKILREIQGKTILELDIERCLNIPNADGVVIATTPEPGAQDIIAVTQKFPPGRVTHFVGSVEDVLARYHGAAESVHAGIIIRITSDCPLLDPPLVERLIAAFRESLNTSRPLDYLCNNNPPSFPHGLDAEVFSFTALDRAFHEAREPFEREHVTPYIRRHPELFRLDNVSSAVNLSHHRWTLDYPEDYDLIRAVYDRLYPDNPSFSTQDILDLLDRHPEIARINEGRRQR